MFRNAFRWCVFATFFVALTAFAAEPGEPAHAKSFDAYVRTMGSDLFQQAYAFRTATGEDSMFQTRFIPTQVVAYPVVDQGRTWIYITVTYLHSGKFATDEEATVVCKSIVNWVRFNLGVRDDGTPMGSVNDFGTSELFRYIPATEAKFETQAYASALDDMTRIRVSVRNLKGAAGDVTCHDGLIAASK